MDGKFAMLRVLRMLSLLCVDFRVSKLLKEFKVRLIPEESVVVDVMKSLTSAFDEKPGSFAVVAIRNVMCSSEDLDLGFVSGTCIEDVLIDLLMYDHPQMVQSALELLLFQFTQRQRVLDVASRVQLLVGRVASSKFYSLQRALMRVRNLAENKELWGALTSPKELEAKS
jgi:hypothetical protein